MLQRMTLQILNITGSRRKLNRTVKHVYSRRYISCREVQSPTRLTMRVFRNDKNDGNLTDAIWLRCGNYQVIPLNPRLRGHIPELECAIQRGISALPDWQRQDFYTLELKTGWAYIHVRENANAVYLVAYSSSNSPHASPARISSEMIEENAAYENA